MRLIHYTDRPINVLEDRKYSQSALYWQAKPNGLWISVEDIGEKIPNNYNWKEWCESENFRIEALAISYEIILKEGANILHLKSVEEIEEFTKLYPLKKRGWDDEWDTNELDWDEIKKKYQGIIISPYQWACRLSLETSWYYGWDCSSGCIWDISCVKEFIKKEVKK